MSKLQNYVLGFAFGDVNHNREVLLIHKEKPDWQKGRINGVGGKIEPDEYLHEAMVREFEEETGIKTQVNDWNLFCRMSQRLDSDSMYSGGADVYCFSNFKVDVTQAQQMESEQPESFRVAGLNEYHPKIMPNLRWLIPMALDSDGVSMAFVDIK